MSEKIRKKFNCEKCDYSTSDKKDWNKHLSTRKHKMVTFSGQKSEDENIIIIPHVKSILSSKNNNNKKMYICNLCSKKYKFNSGLSRHMKTIHSNNKKEIIKEKDEEYSIVKQQQKQINELQNMLKDTLEQNKTTIETLIPKLGDTFNTTHKMTINVFLNEQCKNAMNLTDFVNQLELSLDDLIYTKNHGYVKGISNIFVKHLNGLKPTERPIHCSDKKRLQFYIKDENRWEKDNEHMKIDKSIKTISNKQIGQIKDWENEHPNWNTNDRETEMYMQMVQHVMGATNVNEINKDKENIKKEVGNNIDLKEAIDSC
tara:strand:- start:1326 stop:2270 length:945 start_codon:yes stop_codon:yes gene_type:complete